MASIFLNDVQFQYSGPGMGKSYHTVQAFKPVSGMTNPVHLGTMLWNSKEILNIGTTPGMERRGVATAMWHEGIRLAANHTRIPRPKHSADRTKAGDSWANSVGGRIPRKK